MSATWKMFTDGIIPEDAFFAEDDLNRTLCVGRAHHEGGLLPGKVCLFTKTCSVPWSGEEVLKTQYEILTGSHYKWVPYEGKEILVKAVPGGETNDGSILYIGRTNHNNTVTPGKVYPLTGLLYMPYGGLELTFRKFDILVFEN